MTDLLRDIVKELQAEFAMKDLTADVLLWRNRNISAEVLGGVTAIWILFECLGYHLLTFVCHGLIFSLGVLFLWSNASSFINKSPTWIPEVIIPEDLVVNIALSTRYEINRAFVNLRQIALGRDIKKFLMDAAAGGSTMEMRMRNGGAARLSIAIGVYIMFYEYFCFHFLAM
uniref:Reticulon-like protein n=1 Tax=Setaria italica TaxID=4555 RepID=K3YEF8_SETIT